LGCGVGAKEITQTSKVIEFREIVTGKNHRKAVQVKISSLNKNLYKPV
jgi:hypothetical protein